MDPINNLNPVLEVLRRQLAASVERKRNPGQPAGSSARLTEKSVAQASGFDSILQRRISVIDRSSPEGKAAATYAFVESVLVAEFGEALLSDPALGQMLAGISDSLREGLEIRNQLDDLLGEF